MIKKNSYKFFGILLVLFFSFPLLSFADTDATITLNPKNPSPYSSITLTVSSYSFDVNTANITWKSDNKTILSGQGEKDLTIKTGGIGSLSTITVTVDTSLGVHVEQSITITPESVSLIYESPESYVPLFYEGLALPSDEAKVHFTAMPQMSEGGAFISPKNIAYSWYVNDVYIKNSSGIAKQSATIPLDLLTESTNVKVIARTEGGAVAEKTVKVFPHQILPLLYSYDDILGTNYSQLYTHRIESVKDFTLSLEPYFLSMNGALFNTTSFDWLLDGFPVTPLGGRILSLHPKEDTYGSKNLSISVSNSRRRLQKATNETSLVFDTRK